MPQSRHRKINKAKKRPKSSYPATQTATPTRKNKQARMIAIMIVAALAVAAVSYLIVNRTGSGGGEITTASGLKYSDQVVGTGATPQKGQTVTVHYTGTLENGKKFDSSVDKGAPMKFKFATDPPMIKGWDEALSTMKVGGKRRFIVPPALGYGQQGQDRIPPNSTLIFDVELLEVK